MLLPVVVALYMISFNRTIVELKWCNLIKNQGLPDSFNRTIVELKYNEIPISTKSL